MSMQRKFNKGESVPSAERVNVNRADRDELKSIYRVDDQLANEIVRFRQEHGPFQRPEDLQKVPGLGPDWYQNDAREQITV